MEPTQSECSLPLSLARGTSTSGLDSSKTSTSSTFSEGGTASPNIIAQGPSSFSSPSATASNPCMPEVRPLIRPRPRRPSHGRSHFTSMSAFNELSSAGGEGVANTSCDSSLRHTRTPIDPLPTTAESTSFDTSVHHESSVTQCGTEFVSEFDNLKQGDSDRRDGAKIANSKTTSKSFIASNAGSSHDAAAVAAGHDSSGDAAPTALTASITAAARHGSHTSLSCRDWGDSDENVLARLTEFTEIARRTAAHNEELCTELADERRRVAHTKRKLDQCSSTCTELRESLALAQDTVIKLREHERRWAESTADEMSLRAELCAMKDECASTSGNAAILRNRCETLERDNAELGERFAALAEEKRQVESRARRLLRSDRYRGF